MSYMWTSTNTNYMSANTAPNGLDMGNVEQLIKLGAKMLAEALKENEEVKEPEEDLFVRKPRVFREE